MVREEMKSAKTQDSRNFFTSRTEDIQTKRRMMGQNFTKYAFTDSVKKVQKQYGSRKSYEKMESGDKYVLTDREISFIESRGRILYGHRR